MKTKKYHLEFANFICKFDDKDLADYLDTIFLPAMKSGDIRRRGNATYHILHPTIVNLGDGNTGLAFEFVKNQLLESVQRLEGNEVYPESNWIKSAPSAIVVIILNTHRLVYMPKTKYAPTMQELRATCEILINKFRVQLIESLMEEGERGKKSELRAQLRLQYPRADVKIVPLTSNLSIAGSLRQFKVIDKLSITLVTPNNDLDLDDFFSNVRKTGNDVGAKTTTLVHESKDEAGLKKPPAVKEIKAATQQGNALVEVKGKGQDDSPLTQTNEDLKFKQRATFEPSTDLKKNAKEMVAQFSTLINSGTIAAPTFTQESRNKVNRIVGTLKEI
jgi:hypothetical protein